MAERYEYAPGDVTISRSSPGDGDDYVVITVRRAGQEADGTVTAVQAELTLESFALAITGRARIGAKVRIREVQFPVAHSESEPGRG